MIRATHRAERFRSARCSSARRRPPCRCRRRPRRPRRCPSPCPSCRRRPRHPWRAAARAAAACRARCRAPRRASRAPVHRAAADRRAGRRADRAAGRARRVAGPAIAGIGVARGAAIARRSSEVPGAAPSEPLADPPEPPRVPARAAAARTARPAACPAARRRHPGHRHPPWPCRREGQAREPPSASRSACRVPPGIRSAEPAPASREQRGRSRSGGATIARARRPGPVSAARPARNGRDSRTGPASRRCAGTRSFCSRVKLALADQVDQPGHALAGIDRVQQHRPRAAPAASPPRSCPASAGRSPVPT